MKNRFHWAFELLKARVFSAINDFERSAFPLTDRKQLFEALGEGVSWAKQRLEEFPDRPQYTLYLNEYINLLGGFRQEAEDLDDLGDATRRLLSDLTALDDRARAALGI